MKNNIDFKLLILEQFKNKSEAHALRFKVNTILKAIENLMIESEGGLYLEKLGYFCIIKTKDKIFNDKTCAFEHKYIPYVFTEFFTGKMRYYTYSDFKKYFVRKIPEKDYKTCFKDIKNYYLKNDLRRANSRDRERF